MGGFNSIYDTICTRRKAYGIEEAFIALIHSYLFHRSIPGNQSQSLGSNAIRLEITSNSTDKGSLSTEEREEKIKTQALNVRTWEKA